MPRGLNPLRGVGSARTSAAGTSWVTLEQLSLPPADLGEELKHEPARGAATDKKAFATIGGGNPRLTRPVVGQRLAGMPSDPPCLAEDADQEDQPVVHLHGMEQGWVS